MHRDNVLIRVALLPSLYQSVLFMSGSALLHLLHPKQGMKQKIVLLQTSPAKIHKDDIWFGSGSGSSDLLFFFQKYHQASKRMSPEMPHNFEVCPKKNCYSGAFGQNQANAKINQ